MRQTDNVDKRMVARVMIQKLEDEKKPMEIRTSFLTGYNSPEKIVVKGKDEKHTPDIEAVFDQETNLYSIELDDEMKTDKWRLLSLYARKKHGNLYLVVPDWLRKPVKNKLEEESINAGLIYFNTES